MSAPGGDQAAVPLGPLLDACNADLPWLLDAIRALVGCESPSGDRAAVNRCGAVVSRLLAELGGAVRTIPGGEAGDHIRAEFGDGARQLLILGHLDTVWPVGQLATMPMRFEDGRLYGPGVYDMKAGIGLALLALRALARCGAWPSRRVVVLLTSDEEIGSRSGRPVLEAEARRSTAVLIPEPPMPDGGVKTARKAVGEFLIEAHGVAAHAGVRPEAGASAVLELAHQILALERLQGSEEGLTINAGVVSGGTHSNVVPAYARAEVDVRVPTAAGARRLERKMAELRPRIAGVRLAVSGGVHRPPLERTGAVVQLYEIARHVASALGRDLTEGTTGGGSDGSFTAAQGVPTLDGLGASGDGAHAVHEHVVVDALAWKAALLAGLVLRVP